MPTLGELATFVRSKNAGPFSCTMDVMFADRDTYSHVADSGVLTPDLIAGLYSVPAAAVRIFPFPPGSAIKITIPRLVPCGDPADTDVSAGQQFVPLLGIEIRG